MAEKQNKVPVYIGDDVEIPITARDADFLAMAYTGRTFGGLAVTTVIDYWPSLKEDRVSSLGRLVGTLPEGAKIIDVGAGRSNFGQVVASMRSDIQWDSFDTCYADKSILGKLQEQYDKVRYIPGDIRRPLPRDLVGAYDRVFSYWLLPHLSGIPGRGAEQAVSNMIRMLGSSGRMYFGPLFVGGHNTIDSMGDNAVLVDKGAYNEIIRAVIIKTTKFNVINAPKRFAQSCRLAI